jgi:hypothetical protein
MTNDQRKVYERLDEIAEDVRRLARDEEERGDHEAAHAWSEVYRAIVRAQDEVAQ